MLQCTELMQAPSVDLIIDRIFRPQLGIEKPTIPPAMDKLRGSIRDWL